MKISVIKMAEQNIKRNNKKIQKLTVAACLAALIVVMSFTFIGYLKIGVVSITFIPIPVVIGAIIGGPSMGAVLGAVFGITSLIQCFGMDVFGTTLMSISPLYTVILCIVPRILMGLFCGLIYNAMKNHKVSDNFSFAFTSFVGGFLNTAMFVGLLMLMFGQSDYLHNFGDNAMAIIGTLVTFNALIEWAACLIIGTAVSKALSKLLNKSNN
jgi:uncharacterized membrane protein